MDKQVQIYIYYATLKQQTTISKDSNSVETNYLYTE